MSHEILKKNIELLMQQYGYDIVSLEKKAGLRKNAVYYIVKDKSKEPAVALVQSVADVFDYTIKDLLTPPELHSNLESKDLDLLTNTTRSVCSELKAENISIKFNQIIALVKEAYDYSHGHQTSAADTKFIKWIIKNKYKT